MVEYKYKFTYFFTYIPLLIVMGLLITASFFLGGFVEVLRYAAITGIVITFVGYFLSRKDTYMIHEDKLVMRIKGEDKEEFLFSNFRTVLVLKNSIELGIFKKGNIKTTYISKHIENFDGFKNELLKQIYKSPFINGIIIND